jgi:hypothetical protein
MEITENYIKEKYDIDFERKEIEKHIDSIILYVNHLFSAGTYYSLAGFLAELRLKIEKEYPQIKKVEEQLDQFMKIKLWEDPDEVYLEFVIFQKQFETESETIARLIRKEKNLVSREKTLQRKHKEKIELYNKLKKQLHI